MKTPIQRFSLILIMICIAACLLSACTSSYQISRLHIVNHCSTQISKFSIEKPKDKLVAPPDGIIFSAPRISSGSSIEAQSLKLPRSAFLIFEPTTGHTTNLLIDISSYLNRAHYDNLWIHLWEYNAIISEKPTAKDPH